MIVGPGSEERVIDGEGLAERLGNENPPTTGVLGSAAASFCFKRIAAYPMLLLLPHSSVEV